jgi:molecular chaperone DnaJ
MSDNKDLYEVLGISRDASEAEIKKAYKKMVKKYHPDLNPDSKTAEEKMKEVNHAYDILSDPQKKARYDQFGDDGNNTGGFGGGAGGFGGFGGGDFGDIFDMFFGGGASRSRNQNAPRQGNDLRVDLRVSFEEAAKGTTKEIEINRTESCTDCGGTGAKAGTSRKTCQNCGGSGKIRVNQQTPFGQFQTVKTCPKCGGKGTVVETPCPSCRGTGRVKKNRKIKVNVPPGVDTDSRLRMQNEGEGGINGGPAGDLYIYITVSPHEFFRRVGDDILCNVPITMVQAALGAEIEVDTLDGKVKLTIPAGTQSGTSFRLRGRGFPKLRGYGKGDQHVKVNVQTPTNLTSEQKDLLRKFAETQEGSKENKESKSSNKPKGFFNKKKK